MLEQFWFQGPVKENVMLQYTKTFLTVLHFRQFREEPRVDVMVRCPQTFGQVEYENLKHKIWSV